ncbi:MAG: CAP domain-containing protein [Nocardioidaceae bacterium]
MAPAARLRTTGVLLTLMLAVTAALLVHAPAQGARPAAATQASATKASAAMRAMPSGRYERRLLHWTNVQRERHGRRPVRANRCADRYAEGWTRHMARTGKFEHRDQRVVMRGCNATAAGEVIARGHVTPRRMVRMWMG